MRSNFSSDRSKYDLRVKSFRKDKRQLDGELRKAIDRLKADSDRAELFSFDDAITTDQVFNFLKRCYFPKINAIVSSTSLFPTQKGSRGFQEK